MYELIPILAGAAAGALATRVAATRARAILIASVVLLAALVAGLGSGELAASPLFLLWDAAQAVGAAVVTLLLAPAARHALSR